MMALLLTLFIPPLHQQFRFLLFAFAVAVGASGGVWPGIFATLLSAALAAYFLIPPVHSLAVSDLGDMVRLLLFCGVGLIITWITRRLKRSDETIRAAAAVVESSAESIMRQGLDNTILSWNKAAERIYGYTANEAVGRPVSLIVPRIAGKNCSNWLSACTSGAGSRAMKRCASERTARISMWR